MARINLGRLVRKTSEEVTGKKTSLTADIDKAFETSVGFTGAFSVRKIRKSLKAMLESTETFDREKFFKMFLQFYNVAMAPDSRAKNVFHPSSLLEDCPRRLVYDLSKTPISDDVSKGVSGQLQRIFDVGTWYHLYFQNILFEMGYLEQAEVPVKNDKKYLNGKADGVFKKEVFGEKVLLEIKTMNSFIYKKAIFKPFPKHEFQAGLYADDLGIKKILYLYIDKNTSEIKDFLRPVDGEQLALANSKMDSVIDHVESGTLPKITCADKFCEKALLCPFATKCFKDK